MSYDFFFQWKTLKLLEESRRTYSIANFVCVGVFMSILRRGRSHSVLRHTLAMSGPLQRIEKQKWDWVAASRISLNCFFSLASLGKPLGLVVIEISLIFKSVFLLFTNVKAEAAHVCVGFLTQSSLANQY